MSVPDPSTDSCTEQCCRDYCHRHVSFLLTLALFAGTDSPRLSETTAAFQFALDFLYESQFLYNRKTLLGLVKIQSTFEKGGDFPLSHESIDKNGRPGGDVQR